MYLYPDNLKAKATLFLWELRDVGIIGVGLLLSVFALAQLRFFLPIVATAVEKQVKDAPVSAVTVPTLRDGGKIFTQRFHGSITLPSD